MDLASEKKAARAAFDRLATDGTIATGDLVEILAAIGQPQELEGATSVIRHVKDFSFDASPEGRVAWSELEKFLGSDGRDRR